MNSPGGVAALQRPMLLNLPHGSLLRFVSVEEPGFLPPIWQAVQNCSGDVIAFLDDDAEAHRDWLERLSVFYADSSIGGVGGRYINYSNGVRQYLPVAAFQNAQKMGIHRLYRRGRGRGVPWRSKTGAPMASAPRS